MGGILIALGANGAEKRTDGRRRRGRAGGADLDANFVRPDYVTYPGPTATRRVYYNYPDGGSGAVLSRLDNIASAGSPSASEKYAAYGYFGASTMIKVEYPAVPGDGESLALTYGSAANGYSGFDRFGRTLNQKWSLQSAGTLKDQYTYAYDRAGNRLSRDVLPDAGTPPTGLDHYYSYDGLDRLTQSNRGDLDGGVITDQNADTNQAWTLDTVGNCSQFANSHPKCNGSAPEDFRWSPVVEALSGSVVQLGYIARQLPSCQL
jgi:hypothetical protein